MESSSGNGDEDDGQTPCSSASLAEKTLLHTKKRRIGIVNNRLGVKTVIDATSQTVGNSDENILPHEKEKQQNIEKCPVCLECFNETRKLLVTKCAHFICSKCKLFLTKNGKFPCPLCRHVNYNYQVTQLTCLSLAVLAKSEREKLKHNIESIPKPELLALLKLSKDLINFHKRRMKFLTLPSGLARKSFGQKIPEILTALNTQMIDSKLDRMGRGLKKILTSMETLKSVIDNPSDNVEFDLTGFLEQSVIKAVLKKKGS